MADRDFKFGEGMSDDDLRKHFLDTAISIIDREGRKDTLNPKEDVGEKDPFQNQDLVDKLAQESMGDDRIANGINRLPSSFNSQSNINMMLSEMSELELQVRFGTTDKMKITSVLNAKLQTQKHQDKLVGVVLRMSDADKLERFNTTDTRDILYRLGIRKDFKGRDIRNTSQNTRDDLLGIFKAEIESIMAGSGNPETKEKLFELVTNNPGVQQAIFGKTFDPRFKDQKASKGGKGGQLGQMLDLMDDEISSSEGQRKEDLKAARDDILDSQIERLTQSPEEEEARRVKVIETILGRK